MKPVYIILPALVTALPADSSPREMLPSRLRDFQQCEVTRDVMMAPLCDDLVDHEKAASTKEILAMGQMWSQRSLTSKIQLDNCGCCAVTVSSKSAIKLCNKTHNTTLVSYALAGITSSMIAQDSTCVKAGKTKGGYIWVNRPGGQRFSLLVVAPDSPAMDDTPQCANVNGTAYSLAELPKLNSMSTDETSWLPLQEESPSAASQATPTWTIDPRTRPTWDPIHKAI
ncbi:hypothetical protein BT63DRAFT_457521 [Microthyrium microscopicum]|uniref:Uncharacterized protein n=1 Tax=Microthyrium microscopicum TaxID=703497 RepID=A0A6A6U5L0_9PEZI|nr:hypothetical protein BT63DRAFT_457521 [Microthyrium microscopicum]